MMHKVLNMTELAAICARVEHIEGHHKLLSALTAHYPDYRFNLVRQESNWNRDGRILDRKGDFVADSYTEWLAEAYNANGENAYETWRRYKDEGFVATVIERPTLYLTAPFSTSPEAFHQIEVDAVREVLARPLFSREAPANRAELESVGFYGLTKMKKPTPWRYEFNRLANVRTFPTD